MRSITDVLIDIGAGSIAGGVGCIIGHPLDTVKVRMQRNKQNSMVKCAQQTFAREGVFGFYKGLLPPLVSISLYQAVCFASFAAALPIVTSEPEDTASLKSLFIAGSMSGFATIFVTTPTDNVKIRLQLQTGEVKNQTLSRKEYRGMLHCCSEIAKSEGVAGFFRGLAITAYRDTFSTGIYFTTYHSTKRWLQSLSSSKSSNNNAGSKDDKLFPALMSGAGAELTAGGVAGVLAWGSVIPFDNVKTRLQSGGSESGIYSTFRSIVLKEGLSNLYLGAAPLLIRAFIVNAATFFAYEEAMRTIRRMI